MAGPNGVAVRPGERMRLRAVPETLTIEIERQDGAVEVTGYVKGPGCPVYIDIEVDEVWAAWEDSSPTLTADDRDEHGRLKRSAAAAVMRAERVLRRDLLRAAIPGLTDEDASLLAADAGPWEDVLVALKWWQRVEATGVEDEPGPEATGEAASARPTATATSSPDSAPPTALTTGR